MNILSKYKPVLKDRWKEKIKCLVYYILVFIYLETVLHLVMYKSLSPRIVYPILFAMVSGSILYLICNLLPQKLSKIMGMTVITLLVIYFEVQLVYHCIFGSFMPLSQIGMGAGAITNFFTQLLHAMWTNLIKIILILIPIPVTAVLFAKKKVKTHRIKAAQIPVFIIITLLLSATTLFVLHATNTHVGSAYAILVDPNTSTEGCVRNTGLAATTVQEVKALLAPGKSETNFLYTDLNIIDNEGNETNSIDINFSAVADKTDDNTVKLISKYLAGVSPTSKNEYTGIANLEVEARLKKDVKVNNVKISGRISTTGMCWAMKNFDFSLQLDKNGEGDISNQKWIDMYKVAKKMYDRNDISTEIIWGCQMDATWAWILNNSTKSIRVFDLKDNGNYNSILKNTGNNENYSFNNIYDLCGNVSELSQRSSQGTGRIAYGGSYFQSKQYSFIEKNSYAMTYKNNDIGTRVTMYLN